jgi:hypothetical protein
MTIHTRERSAVTTVFVVQRAYYIRLRAGARNAAPAQSIRDIKVFAAPIDGVDSKLVIAEEAVSKDGCVSSHTYDRSYYEFEVSPS